MASLNSSHIQDFASVIAEAAKILSFCCQSAALGDPQTKQDRKDSYLSSWTVKKASNTAFKFIDNFTETGLH